MDPHAPSSHIDGQDCSEKYLPSASARIIGASCGAFVFCFVAILITHSFNQGVNGQKIANFIWIGALFCGAIGGFAFPRVGHFLAYTFVFFINIILSITIGRNLGEQIGLFATLIVGEIVFLQSKGILRDHKT